MTDWSMNDLAIAAGHKPYDPDSEWQLARIATRQHVERFHSVDPGAVTAAGGDVIRVRRSMEAQAALAGIYKRCFDCDADYFVEVHPEDAAKYWPKIVEEGASIALCEHLILVD